MKTKVFRKVTIFLVMAIYIAGCSNSFDDGMEFKTKIVSDDLLVQIAKEEFDKMPNEYKGSGQIAIAQGITLEKNAENKNNDFILIFEPDAAQGTLRIAIKKGNEFYISVFVISELPAEGSMFLFRGSNLSTLKFGFEPEQYGGQGVYVATYEFPNGGGCTDVKLWKNGVAQNISDINYVTSVFVTDDDVYLAGFGFWYAALWKNGKVQILSKYESFANSVFVSGDDVYVAGCEYPIINTGGGPPIISPSSLKKTGISYLERSFNIGYQLMNPTESSTKSYTEGTQVISVAKVWKNGEAQDLTDGIYDALAKSVYVSGEDVYAAGREYNEHNIPVAKLWKNGKVQDLTDGIYEAWTNSVFVSDNGDVYVAGHEYNASGKTVAKLWKNGKALDLTNGTRDGWARSVYVLGNDVYVAGTERNAQGWEVAKLWKNGVVTNLTNEYNDYNVSAEAHSVNVSGNDVYVAGFVWNGDNRLGTVATVWKNGVAQNLTEGGNKHGYTYSVFAK